jgi:halimadienyl-diphosphate synthase
MDYLVPLVKACDGGAPPLTPIEVFERLWALWNLSLTNLWRCNEVMAGLCKPHLDYLENHWLPGKGLGFSALYTPTDSDDTGVAYELLSKFGRQPDLNAVLAYEEADWFRCFQHEANPSVDVNIHVLGALKQAGFDKSHPSVQKAVKFIRSRRLHNQYWLDKWNLSPYYTTAHATVAASGYDDQLCQESIDWICNTQMNNGAWGFYRSPTAEETAYCIQALARWQQYAGKSFQGNIQRGATWLLGNCEPPYPPLWIGKSLYCPEILVKSCILSALQLARES